MMASQAASLSRPSVGLDVVERILEFRSDVPGSPALLPADERLMDFARIFLQVANAPSLLEEAGFNLSSIDIESPITSNYKIVLEKLQKVCKQLNPQFRTLTDKEKFYGRVILGSVCQLAAHCKPCGDADNIRLLIWLSLDVHRSATFPLPIHFHSASAAIKKTDPTFANDETAQQMLGMSLYEHLRSFSRIVLSSDLPALSEINGMLSLDSKFSDFLKKLGPKGKKAALELSKSSQERWRENLEDKNSVKVWRFWHEISHDKSGFEIRCKDYYSDLLAIVLWHDEVKIKWEHVTKPAARPLTASRDLYSLVMSSNVSGDRLTHDRQDVAKIELSDRLSRKAQPEVPAQLFAMVQKDMRSVAAYRLMTYACQTAHQQWCHKMPNPNQIKTEGGWQQLAANAGMKKGKQSYEIEQAARALDAIVPLRGILAGKGRILAIMNDLSAAPGRKAIVEIQINSFLMGQSVHQMEGIDRRLVPIPHREPPLYGRSNEHASQLWLQMEIISILREHAIELLNKNGVRFDKIMLTTLEHKYKLRINSVLDHWVAGSNTAVPFLIRTDQDTYNLSDHFTLERGMILEAAKIMEAASRGGKKTQEMRKARIFGNRAK